MSYPIPDNFPMMRHTVSFLASGDADRDRALASMAIEEITMRAIEQIKPRIRVHRHIDPTATCFELDVYVVDPTSLERALSEAYMFGRMVGEAQKAVGNG